MEVAVAVVVGGARDASTAVRRGTCLERALNPRRGAAEAAAVEEGHASTAARTGTCRETVLNPRSRESLVEAVVVAAVAEPASTVDKMATCLANALSLRSRESPRDPEADLVEEAVTTENPQSPSFSL